MLWAVGTLKGSATAMKQQARQAKKQDERALARALPRSLGFPSAFPPYSPTHHTLHRFGDSPSIQSSGSTISWLSSSSVSILQTSESIASSVPSVQGPSPPSTHKAKAMLVPKFSLQQTAETVVVTIKLPYVRVGDAEVSVVRVVAGFLVFSKKYPLL